LEKEEEEAAMKFIDPMIAQLKHEAAVTRKFLERIPEDKFDWKPHEKCMALGYLSSHIAESLSWTREVVEKDEIDIQAGSYQPWEGKTRAEISKKFDDGLRDAIDAMKGVSNEALGETWTMKVGGETAFSAPRGATLQAFIISHMIHHRAQLGLYLRLNDIPVPQAYGPTADEK